MHVLIGTLEYVGNKPWLYGKQYLVSTTLFCIDASLRQLKECRPK